MKTKNIIYKLTPFICIILMALIFEPTSPFYHYGDGKYDMQISFAVVKALMHGEIYLKDIFEQRGLYFYWLSWPGMLTNNIYFAQIWLWLIEIANFCGIYLLFQHLKKQPQINTLMTCLLMLFLYTMQAGEPEDLCLFVFAYTAYLVITIKKLSWQQNLLLGLLFGFIIEIKYGMIGIICGFYFGYGMYLLYKKQFKMFLQTVLVAVSGVLIAQIPLVIYELHINNLNNYLIEYFISNSSNLGNTLVNLSIIIAYLPVLLMTTLVLLLPLKIAFTKLPKLNQWLFGSSMLFSLIFASLIGHYIQNYAWPIIILLFMLAMPYIKTDLHVTDKLNKLFVICSFVVTGTLLLFNLKTQYRFFTIPAPISYQMSQIIDENPGKAMTLHALGDSIYLNNSEYPKLKHFETVNIDYDQNPTQYDAQKYYLETKKAKWVSMTINANYFKSNYVPSPSQYESANLQLYLKPKKLNLKIAKIRYFIYIPMYKPLLNNYNLVWLKGDPNYFATDHSPKVLLLWLRKGEKVPQNCHVIKMQ